MNTYKSSDPYSIACTLPHALSARQDCSLANTVKRIVPSEEVCLATRAPFLRALHIPTDTRPNGYHCYPILQMTKLSCKTMDAQPQIKELPGAEAETGTPAAPPDPPVGSATTQSALPTESVCTRWLLRCLFLLPFIVFGFWTITTDKRYSSDSAKLTRKKHLDRKRR